LLVILKQNDLIIKANHQERYQSYKVQAFIRISSVAHQQSNTTPTKMVCSIMEYCTPLNPPLPSGTRAHTSSNMNPLEAVKIFANLRYYVLNVHIGKLEAV